MWCTNAGYRVLADNRIIVARNVDIVEKDVKCIGISSDDILICNEEIEADQLSSQSEYEDIEKCNTELKGQVKVEIQVQGSLTFKYANY